MPRKKATPPVDPTPEEWEPRKLWKVLGFTPHGPGQREILKKVHEALDHKEGAPRFIDCTTGRQWGKSTLAEMALWDALLRGPDALGQPPSIKIISDTYEHTNLIWDKFTRHLFSTPGMTKLLDPDYSRERELITLTNGAQVQKLSSDRPQALTGHTLTLAIVDEAAFVADEAIQLLLPSLAVRQGVLLAFGTAEGVGWHRTWYLRGLDSNYPDHWCMTAKSTDNPFFPPDELRIQELMMPARRFHQLYLAEWQGEEGAVFHNIDGCTLWKEPLEVAPVEGREYIMGVDFARHHDFTAAYVADARTRRVVRELRFTDLEWLAQVERIQALAGDYNNAMIYCDATGVGDVLVELLQGRGLNVSPYVMTPGSKDRIIQALVLALEREEIRFPEYPQLRRELQVYETRVLPSGRVQTGAPVGYHDDCPTALALVNWGLRGGMGRGGETLSVEKFGWQ